MGLAQLSSYLIGTFNNYFNSMHLFTKQLVIRDKNSIPVNWRWKVIS